MPSPVKRGSSHSPSVAHSELSSPKSISGSVAGAAVAGAVWVVSDSVIVPASKAARQSVASLPRSTSSSSSAMPSPVKRGSSHSPSLAHSELSSPKSMSGWAMAGALRLAAITRASTAAPSPVFVTRIIVPPDCPATDALVSPAASPDPGWGADRTRAPPPAHKVVTPHYSGIAAGRSAKASPVRGGCGFRYGRTRKIRPEPAPFRWHGPA